MTGRTHPTEAGLRFLLGLAEMARPVISAGILVEQLGDEAGPLIDSGSLVPDSGRRSILLAVGETEVDIPVERDGVTGKMRCFHPEAGFMDVDPGRLGAYCLDLGCLPGIVRSLLDMPTSVKPLPLVPDLLWDLGEDYLTQRKFPIYLVRRLGRVDVHARILDALGPRRARGPSLLLTIGAVPRHLALPPEYRAIAVTDSLVPDGRGVRLDKAILRGVLVGGGVPAVSGPLFHTIDFDVVTVHGKDHAFPGPKQRALIRQLVEAFLAGQPRCLTAKVLENAEYKDSVNTLAKAFGKRDDWRKFIAEEGGSCWIFL